MSHKSLLELIKRYQSDMKKPLLTEGICFGYSHVYMNALLLGQRDIFYKRMRLIKQYEESPQTLIDRLNALKLDISERHKTPGFKLSEEEIELLQVAAFIDTMILQHIPDLLPELYGGNVRQHYLSTFALSHPDAMDKPPELLHETVYAMTSKELFDHLRKLEHTLSITGERVGILIDTGIHQVTLSWDSEFAKWEYMDINHPNVEAQSLNAHELVTTMFSSMSGIQGGEHAVMKVNYFSRTPAPRISHTLSVYDQNLTESKVASRTNAAGFTVLHFTARDGLLAITQDILESVTVRARRQLVNHVSTKQQTSALTLAIQHGQLDTVRFLLTHTEVNVNENASKGLTPLLSACYKGYNDIVIELLQHPRLDVNQCGATPLATALTIAILSHNAPLLEILLTHKDFILTQINMNGVTALHIAINTRDPETIKLLLKDPRTEINQPTLGGFTPLMLAVISKDPNLVSLLLEHGAKDEMTPELGTAYQYAREHDLQDILKILDQRQSGVAQDAMLATLTAMLAELDNIDEYTPPADYERIDDRPPVPIQSATFFQEAAPGDDTGEDRPKSHNKKQSGPNQ